MELVDIGCNLTHDSFDPDRAEVLERARAVGVVQMIVTGASEDSSLAAFELAREHPGVLFATAGIHPHRASDFSASAESVLRDLLSRPGVVAVGETGLDYFRDLSPRPAQRSSLEHHLQMAIDTGLPLFLHQRDAHEDFVAILRPLRDRLPAIVVHCFTGTRDELRDYLDLDCHVGITGWICDERRGSHMKDFMADIPAHRLMVESDAPYLKPRDLRPLVRTHRNEPRWLPWVAATLAACRHETPEQLAACTTTNARRFFSLPAH